MNSITPLQKSYQTTQQSFKDRWNQNQKKKTKKTEDEPKDNSTSSEELSSSRKVWYC